MICAAFSLEMLEGMSRLILERVDLATARKLAAGKTSAVWNPETAKLFEKLLGVPVPYTLCSTRMQQGKDLLVGQIAHIDGPQVTWWHIRVGPSQK